MQIKRMLHITAIMLILSAAPAVSMAKGWDPNPKVERAETKPVVRDSEVEVRAKRGVILVSVNHATQVKVFTILGQLISSETLPAGTSQYNVSAHGVYIVKIGTLTCKVAV